MFFSAVLEEVGEDHDSRSELTRLHNMLDSNQMLMYINSSRGGPVLIRQAHIISTNYLEGPAEHGGEPIILTKIEASSMSDWSRTPAQTLGGKDLEFEIDEIDVCLLDAHRNYRPGNSGSDSSKTTTVFDYIEKRIMDEELVPDLDYSRI